MIDALEAEHRALMDKGHALTDKDAAIAAARGLALTSFDENALRDHAMAEAASIVAAIPQVRAALVDLQRAFARRPGGVGRRAPLRRGLCGAFCFRLAMRPAPGGRIGRGRRGKCNPG